ncbi:MAG: hypothetical protein QOE22_706 [Candidatus Parcubacteria bacterium]|jgi:hypothetical protein|nr:hypothetical protein [Candidatus Parcubacteria bacterium]
MEQVVTDRTLEALPKFFRDLSPKIRMRYALNDMFGYTFPGPRHSWCPRYVIFLFLRLSQISGD